MLPWPGPVRHTCPGPWGSLWVTGNHWLGVELPAGADGTGSAEFTRWVRPAPPGYKVCVSRDHRTVAVAYPLFDYTRGAVDLFDVEPQSPPVGDPFNQLRHRSRSVGQRPAANHGSFLQITTSCSATAAHDAPVRTAPE